VYGVEAGTTGLGGLQATAPAGYAQLGRALMIRPGGSALIGGPPQNGTVIAASGIGDQTATLPIVSRDGSKVERDPSLQLDGWRSITDFHNSPAPWILIGILIFYTWSHLAHGRRGR
jgi:hypothetical protein